MNSTRGNTSGFTIVELLVTLVVGAIFTASVTVFLGLHVHLAQRGRDVAVANSFAENEVEALRSAGYLSLSDGTTDLTSSLPVELNNNRSASLTISSPSTGIKKVDISVTYNDQGAPRTYSYTTYIGELGVGQY